MQKQHAAGRAQHQGEGGGPPGEGPGSEDPMGALRATGRQDDAMSHLCLLTESSTSGREHQQLDRRRYKGRTLDSFAKNQKWLYRRSSI